jgi:hypothetical protein
MSKYAISLSIIMNAILIMVLVGTVPFFLFAISLFCVVLMWYTGQLLAQMKRCRADLLEALHAVQNFEQHIESVHGLEMFYGDETLGALMSHSKACAEDLRVFAERYAIDEDETSAINEGETSVEEA